MDFPCLLHIAMRSGVRLLNGGSIVGEPKWRQKPDLEPVSLLRLPIACLPATTFLALHHYTNDFLIDLYLQWTGSTIFIIVDSQLGVVLISPFNRFWNVPNQHGRLTNWSNSTPRFWLNWWSRVRQKYMTDIDYNLIHFSFRNGGSGPLKCPLQLWRISKIFYEHSLFQSSWQNLSIPFTFACSPSVLYYSQVLDLFCEVS